MSRTAVALISTAIVALVIFGPLLLIWSLNTLFGLGIAYGLKTWLASFLLGGMFTAKASK